MARGWSDIQQQLTVACAVAEYASDARRRQLALVEATHRVLSYFELDVLGPVLLETACSLTGAAAGVLRLRDGERAVPEIVVRGAIDPATLISLQVGGPPSSSFLVQSMRLRARRTAELCLLPPPGAELSRHASEMLSTLAPAATVAIDNAYRLAEVNNRQTWLQVSTDVSELLRSGPERPLELMLKGACEAAGADGGYVASVDGLDGSREAMVAVCHYGPELGPKSQKVSKNKRESLAFEVGKPAPDASAIDRAIGRGRPIITTNDWVGVSVQDHLMVVPVIDDEGTRAALVIGRRGTRRRFTDIDLLFAENFVDHAVLSLKLTQAREGAARMLLLEERDKIARDLQDHVIARLFSTGLALERIAADIGSVDGEGRLLARIGDIDDTIREIRSSVFQLAPRRGGRAPEADSAVVIQSLLDIAAEWEESLGFAPRLGFRVTPGKISNEIADDLRAVIREALSNIARHAHAAEAAVDLVVDGKSVRLTVSDDGVGLTSTNRSSGLENLRRRADRWGGTFTARAGDGRGTTLVWSVPIGTLG